MNRDIQLHDCELSGVTYSDGLTSVVFSTAYIHESSGVPGGNPGRVWSQAATLLFTSTTPVSLISKLPIWVLDGSLRIGQILHEGFIPAGGHFEEATEFFMTLSTADGKEAGTFAVRGDGVMIELFGEPSDVEEFNDVPRRSI